MGGSTKVEAPPPQAKSAEEIQLLQAQSKQLENLTNIQQAQFEQFQSFAPAQLQAFEKQVELANLAAEEARRAAPYQAETLATQAELLRLSKEEATRRAPLEQEAFATQAELLKLSKEEAQRRAQIDKLTLPAILEAAGQRPVFDEAGNIVSIEKIPPGEKTELERIQEEFAVESGREALRGIRGEVPVGDVFERKISEDRTVLHENLRRQLGPGYETSTPGIQALSEFEARANEARENIRFGRLTQTAALSDMGSERLNQALLRDLDILQRERASAMPGTFSMAGGVGSGASEKLAQAFAMSGGVGGSSNDALTRAFGLSQNVMAPGSQALLRSADISQMAGGFAGGMAGQYAQDRRLTDQYNYQSAIQSAANRAQTTAGMFNMFGTALGIGGGLYARKTF